MQLPSKKGVLFGGEFKVRNSLCIFMHGCEEYAESVRKRKKDIQVKKEGVVVSYYRLHSMVHSEQN